MTRRIGRNIVGSEVKNENVLKGFDIYAFGSATYHGEMLKGMKTVLFLAEKAEANFFLSFAFYLVRAFA